MSWFASIFEARESKDENITEEEDGTYSYDKSGTYGQSDYTVRKRDDDTYDVYVESDSERGHSHDHIDSDGNLIESYHDCMLSAYMDDIEEKCVKSRTLKLK